MNFGSVCSGIEAASVAWLPLGWRCSFMSEIAPFPRAVLAHHFPSTTLHGDFRAIERDPSAPPLDVLVGGTPCQSFSLAGFRAGIRDPRGALALHYFLLVARLRPRWFLWENVSGALAIDGGRAFGTILRAVEELGYGWAYRVLDARYYGTPQRRRRVFLLGHSGGSWQRPASVLFDREGVQGPDPKGGTPRPSRPSHPPGGPGAEDRSYPREGLANALLARREGWDPDQTFPIDVNGPRRLTPVECERLQGFPDNWTRIPFEGDPDPYPDRLRAIGNSIHVPTLHWLGERLNLVDAIPSVAP